MKVDLITVTCSVCKKQSNMEFTAWGDFKLPHGWKFRTRSFNVDDTPSEMQIACSDECRSKL